MKKIDLGQSLSLLANISVVLGIVFLWVELRQNNQELASQRRIAMLEMLSAIDNQFVENRGGIGDILGKALRGQDLDGTERARINVRTRLVLDTIHVMYLEDPAETSRRTDWIARLMSTLPDSPAIFRQYKATYDSAYVAFLEPLLEDGRSQ
jgi:hypothetical protein